MSTNHSSEYLLEVNNLRKYFPVEKTIFGRVKKQLHAVDGVSFRIKRGETLGIVGESGCGKSTVGNTIVRLLDPDEGEILFEGEDISKLKASEMRRRRASIQMIFQDPYSSLNPRMRVGDIIAEPFRTHKVASGAELREKVHACMKAVGLDISYADRYPHEFSGGQRQRIGIARAIALNPKMIICDEPVSALDVSIQAQILNLLMELQKKYGLTYIFIAHGLPTVRHISTNIAVMYLGKIVEIASKDALFEAPMHPYTEGLLQAVPIPDPTLRQHRGKILEGDLPSSVDPSSGCRFHTRCPYAQDMCMQHEPPMREQAPNHYVCCHFPLNISGDFVRR